MSAPKACFEFLSTGNHGLLKKPSGNYRTSFQDACLYANRAHPSLRLLMVEGCTQRCPGRQERLPYSLALPSQLCMQRELSFSYIRFCFPHFLVSFPFLAFLFWKSSFKKSSKTTINPFLMGHFNFTSRNCYNQYLACHIFQCC